MKFIKLSIFTIALASMAFVACSKKTTSTQSTDNSTVTQRSTTSDVPQRGERGQRGGRKAPPQFSDLLGKMDANQDGQLSTTEVEGRLKERFSTIDSNSDGFITEEEFKNAPRPQRGNRGPRNQ